MRASDLTHRVALQRATEARDSFGEPVRTWTNKAMVWASLEWGDGSEGLAGGRSYAEMPVVVRVRRSSDTRDVREKDRALVPLASTRLKEVLATTSDTSVVVDKDVFPPENEFCVRVREELMLVTTKSGTTLTVTRGAFGTSAAKHQPGTEIVHMAPLDVEGVVPAKSAMTMTCVRHEVRL